jgi:ferredoxin
MKKIYSILGCLAIVSAGYSQSKSQETNIYVFNNDVQDKEVIISSIENNNKVIILKDADNFKTLNKKLATISANNKIKSINIFSHGTEGEFEIGNEVVNANSIKKSEQTGSFYLLNTLLGENASLNIYSCFAGAGENGKALFNAISTNCYFNVAMSDDKTGANGDWDLELSKNNTTNPGLNTAKLNANYKHSLQTVALPYCITTLGVKTGGYISEITQDNANGLIYTAGTGGTDLWSFDMAGTATNVATAGSWYVPFHPYVSTDIQFLNDSIFFMSSGGQINTTFNIGVGTTAAISEHTVTPTTSYEAGTCEKNGLLYMSDGNNTGGNIWEYDHRTNISTVVVTGMPNGSFDGLEYCSATDKMYYMNSTSGIYEVDVIANSFTLVVATAALTAGQSANFCIDPSGQYAYVHHGATISKYDLAAGTGAVLISAIPGGNTSQDLEFAPSSTQPNSYSLYFGGNTTLFEMSSPVFALPTVADAIGQCSVTLVAPTYTACATTTTATTTTPSPVTTQGTTVVTWTFDDGNGGQLTVSQNVIITDVTAPVEDVATLTDATDQCSVAAITAPTATDNCAGTVTGTTTTTFPITTQGTTTITWTYVDGNGNSSTQTQDVVITDVTAPVEDVATLTDATDQCSVAAITAPTATDNCVGAVTGTTTTTFPITAQGTTTITWTYVDGNGNSSTQTQDVVITDVTAPVEDVATLTDATDPCSVAAITSPTATDNCAGTVTGTTTTTFPITTQGTTTITWTYVDGNGNSSTQTQDVVITDLTAPVEDVTTLTDATDPCAVAAITAPTATDNCAGAVTGTTTTTFPITAQGTTTITWTYVDAAGNSSTQTQDVVITDVTAPVEDVAVLTDSVAECSLAAAVAPTATDNCAGAVTGTTTTTFPITAQGTTTITWTYDDGNGNSSTQTQDVVITDVTAPVEDVATLTDATDQCAVAAITAPTATDNCAGTVTGTTTTTFPITAQGTTTITWTYDDGNGNSSTQTQDVVITDVTAPVEDVATLTDATGQCSVAAITAPTATDNCVGTVTGTTTTTFPITAQGTTTITWTYDDGNGNSSTQTQDVVITDVTAPVEDVATLADSVSECDVTPIAPTATDNCAGAVTGTTTTTFPITAQGTTTITWTYVDGNGNSSTQTQDVVITPIDTTVTLSGDTMTANATGYSYQWVDCDNGNTPVAGATNQSFIPTTGGNYAVEISNGDCMYMSACDLSTVSVNENNILSTINIYPNPANDFINVSMANGGSSVNFTLLSIDGKVVYQLNNVTDKKVVIDISNNSKGIYFLKVSTDNDSNVYKVIKQ